MPDYFLSGDATYHVMNNSYTPRLTEAAGKPCEHEIQKDKDVLQKFLTSPYHKPVTGEASEMDEEVSDQTITSTIQYHELPQSNLSTSHPTATPSEIGC